MMGANLQTNGYLQKQLYSAIYLRLMGDKYFFKMGHKFPE